VDSPDVGDGEGGPIAYGVMLEYVRRFLYSSGPKLNYPAEKVDYERR
jgi:hypothetical protein